MKSSRQKKVPPLVAAGMLLRDFSEHQLVHGDASRATTVDVIAKVRELAEQATPKALTVTDRYRLLAVMNAADALERQVLAARGDLSVERNFFEAAVENHQGGPREVNLGGRPVENKKSAKENFLRAAAVELWKSEKGHRDRLVSEAKKYLGIKSRKALRKLPSRYREHEKDPARGSPMSRHMDSVRRLRTANGWTSLKDFIP